MMISKSVAAALILTALYGCAEPADPAKAHEVAPLAAADQTPPAAKPSAASRVSIIAPGRWESWDVDEDGDQKTYRLGEVDLTFSSLKTETDSYGSRTYGVEVVVRAPGMAPYRLKDDEVSAFGSFGVGRIDMARPAPQVLLGLFTGGAHCCTRYILLTPEGGAWSASELGMVDKSMSDWPVDRNGDGKPEMLIGDDRFNYAFASYAGSWAPYAFWQIEDGKVVDVSSDKGFASMHRDYMKDAEKDCRQHDNGACAGFVAAAARAGDFDRAWKVMLDNYNREDDWELPSGCKVARVDYECPKGQEITYANYPDALRGFLKDYGYIPR